MHWVDIHKGHVVKAIRSSKYSDNNDKVIACDSEYIVLDKDHSGQPVSVADLITGKHCGWYSADCFIKMEQTKTKGGFGMENLKAYFKKNEDTFITLAIVILVDNYLFEGQFREKIKNMLDKIITGSEKKLLGDAK